MMPSPVPPANMTPERVLILDDDELILRALARVLDAAGFSTRCFASSSEALRNCRSGAIHQAGPLKVTHD